MKKESIYLVPTVTNGNGLILEYKIIKKRKDLRFNFCKKYDRLIINESKLEELKNMFHIKENRLIAKNGYDAYKVQKMYFNKIDFKLEPWFKNPI